MGLRNSVDSAPVPAKGQEQRIVEERIVENLAIWLLYSVSVGGWFGCQSAVLCVLWL
jgi:hypothetical protein